MDSIIICNNFIKLCNKHLNFIDKFQNTFRDDHQSVIFAKCGPPDNNVTDHPGQMAQGHPIGVIINLFAPLPGL